MIIPECSALLLVDVQDSKNKPAVYQGEEQQKKRNQYLHSVKITTDYFRGLGNVPIIHIIELHRDDLVDFGRELDGAEHVHCLEKDSFFWSLPRPSKGSMWCRNGVTARFSARICRSFCAVLASDICSSAGQ